MRILHTNIGIYPERGGPPAVIVNLAAAQSRLGHEVAIASGLERPDAIGEQRRMLDQVAGGSAVTVVKVPFPRFARGLLGGWGPLPIAQLDVVHIHELWNPFDAFIARSARMAGVPYVVTPHGLLSAPRLRHHWLRKRLARFLYVDAMMRRARCVQGLTSHECAEIASLVADVRVRRVPNGFSALAAEPGYAPSFNPPVRKPFLLFMGRIHRMKGVDLLVPALEALNHRHPGLQLVIAGPDDGALQELDRQVRGSSVRERVHIVGMVEGQQKRWLLGNAAAFILPSRSEGFSVAILEALSTGVPSVISRECHFPEAVEAGAAMEADLHPEGIARAVDSILSSDELRKELSSSGSRFAVEGYTWDRVAEQLIALYGEA